MKTVKSLYLESIYKYKFHSLLSKIFISYISILLIVCFINIAIYYYVRNIVVEKEIDTSKDYLNYVRLIFDGELSQIKERMYAFLGDPENVKNLNNITDDISNQVKLVKALTNFKNNSRMVDQCYLYNKEIPYVLGNNGTESKSVLFDYFYSYYNMNDSQIADMLDKEKKFRTIPGRTVSSGKNKFVTSAWYGKPKDVISLVTGVNYSSNSSRLVVAIDEKDIYNVLTNTNIVSYGEAYIIDRNGYIISSSDSNKTGNKFDEALLNEINEYNNGIYKLNFHNNLVVYEKSKFFDGYYVTVIPYSHFLKNINTIRYIFMYSLIVLAILGIVVSGMFSRSFYEPILALMGKFNTSKTYGKEYKDEFALINSLIENIQDNNSRYEENAALGKMMETGDYFETIEKIFRYESFLTIVITSYLPTKITEYVQDYIVGNKLGDNYLLKATKGNEGDCYLVVNGREIDMQSVMDYILELKKSLDEKCGVFTAIGIGNICSGIQELNISLKNALIAIKQGVSHDEQCIFKYQDKVKDVFKIYFPMDFEDRIMDVLTSGSEDKVDALISNIFEQNHGLPHIYMKIIYNEFTNVYIKIANKYEYSFNLNGITINIDHEYRVSHAKNYIVQLYQELLPIIRVHRDTTKTVANFILDYIEKNYSKEDMNIEEIADKLNLSPAYVSTLFKKSNGTSFSQYLFVYRINKAKELLANTNYSVKEVSQKVGGGTYNSFIRSFGKALGISPGEYRSMIKNNCVKL